MGQITSTIHNIISDSFKLYLTDLVRFIMRPSYRPYYASCCPSVRLTVCPAPARNSKTKKRRKSKLVSTMHRARVRVPIFSWKDQRSRCNKVTGHQKPQGIAAVLAYMFTYGRRCKLCLTHLTHYCQQLRKTLGNRSDGRISCRQSTPTCVLVFIP